MNPVSASLAKPTKEDKPRRLSLANANFQQRGDILMSADRHRALRVRVDGNNELNLAFKKVGNSYNAVLVDDNGTEVRPGSGSFMKDITDPLQGLNDDELESYLYKAYTSKYEMEPYRGMIKNVQGLGDKRTQTVSPVAMRLMQK